MKPGVRAMGIAESYGDDRTRSTLAGAVVRADGTADGFGYETTTVGGTDATDAITDLFSRVGREDVRYLLVAGVALSWYNLVDLDTVHEGTDRPVLAVTFEESDGLRGAIREAFDDPEAVDRRLATYDALPPRHPVTVNGETVYVRHVGVDRETADRLVRGFTHEGGRPEPLRVARLAARAADDYVRRW